VAGVECQRVNRFDIQSDGRWIPDVIEGSDFVIDADVVVFSIGQKAGLSFIPDTSGISVDPNSFATDRAGVFAAGDAVSGTAFVIEAVASGHRSATAIGRFLRGEDMDVKEPEQPVASFTQAQLDARVRKGEIVPTPRVHHTRESAELRSDSFAEVDHGFTAEQARAEAARCLSCGVCSECLSCVDACDIQAIDMQQVAVTRDVSVGAVVMAPGFKPYDARQSEELGLGRYPNVVSSIQYERLLSASGPTRGKILRPSDNNPPRRIAWLQCVGSRDAEHDYCSSVCCMYATKQATITKEHWPETEIEIFMMDMRSFSKGYEAYYNNARKKLGIGYTRCRVSRIIEEPKTRSLVVRFMDRQTNSVREEDFDMVVLSSGMEMSDSTRELADRLGVEVDQNGFCNTVQHNPLQTSREGIYAVGPFQEPKDIPESLLEASGAAAQAGAMLRSARGS